VPSAAWVLGIGLDMTGRPAAAVYRQAVSLLLLISAIGALPEQPPTAEAVAPAVAGAATPEGRAVASGAAAKGLSAAQPWESSKLARGAGGRSGRHRAKEADKIISLLTMDEKLRLLNTDSPAVNRSGVHIPAFNWW